MYHIAEWRKFETRHIFHTLLWVRSFSTFTKFSETYLLIRTRTCAYQGVRNISISENFTKAWNEWCLSILSSILQHSQVFQIFNSRHLPIQSYQWKHQKKVWNLFEVNNKDTRTIWIFIINFLMPDDFLSKELIFIYFCKKKKKCTTLQKTP